MKNFIFIILALSLVVYLEGCGKKQQPLEEMQLPMSPEDLSRMAVSQQPMSEMRPAAEPALSVVEQKPLPQLPPPGPYQPTIQEIQTALKNAGYYAGVIDGKIGPLTRNATKEFQKANALQVDGKVGPRTWAVLSKYLNTPASSSGE